MTSPDSESFWQTTPPLDSDNTGMSEDQLRAWLEGGEPDAGIELVDTAQLVDQTEFQELTPATGLAVAETVEIEEISVDKPFEETNWGEPWKASETEAILPTTNARRRLATKGLHTLSDERRILLLAFIGLTPEGTDGNKIGQRYRAIAPESSYLKDQIERWLIGNGLANMLGRVKGSVRELALTEDGMDLLPMAGHLLDWAIRHGKLANPIGRPIEAKIDESGDELVSSSRYNLEQLDHVLQNAGEVMYPKDIEGIEGANSTYTNRFIHRLKKAGWVIAVPGVNKKEEDYPLFLPKPPHITPKIPTNVEEAVRHFVAQRQEEKPGPMSLHGLVYHRKYPTISRRVGGAKIFTTKVFQEYAKMRENGHFEELNPGRLMVTRFALNPYWAPAISDLVEIVRGAEKGSVRYDLVGRQKLFQHCTSPSKELTDLIGAS